MEIIEKIRLSFPEVKEYLDPNSSKPTERINAEYVQKFSYMSKEKAVEVRKKLIELGIPDNVAVMMINSVPKIEEEIAVFPGCESLPAETVKKIIEIFRNSVELYQEDIRVRQIVIETPPSLEEEAKETAEG
ncbi:MAG: hypothetical protein QXL15_04890 [Candidatus Korarchaeota archaeon]